MTGSICQLEKAKYKAVPALLLRPLFLNHQADFCRECSKECFNISN